jgi:hypothetical protein
VKWVKEEERVKKQRNLTSDDAINQHPTQIKTNNR